MQYIAQKDNAISKMDVNGLQKRESLIIDVMLKPVAYPTESFMIRLTGTTWQKSEM